MLGTRRMGKINECMNECFAKVRDQGKGEDMRLLTLMNPNHC